MEPVYATKNTKQIKFNNCFEQQLNTSMNVYCDYHYVYYNAYYPISNNNYNYDDNE